MRLGKALMAGVPFLLIDFVLVHLVRNGLLEHPATLLWFPLAALVAAGMAARSGATWKENVLGFALALIPFLDQQMTAILPLLFVAPGLFLAPAVCGPVRAEPELAVPIEKVAGGALAALVAIAILMGSAGNGDPDEVLVYVTIFALAAQVFGALVSIFLSLTGNARAAAWVGGISGAAFLMSYAALLTRL